jgi:DNA repair protein RadC
MSNYIIKEKISDGLGTLSTKSLLLDLPDEELLQTIMPKEVACQLLAEYGDVYEAVMNISTHELAGIKGMGKSKIYKIECLREIVRRFYRENASKVTVIKSPEDIFEYMADMQYLKQEQFRIIMLNTKNKIIGDRIITQGTVSATLVSPREVFSPAVRNMATSIIVIHNHPSGDSIPSKEDIDVTNNIVEVGKIMSIPVIDHIIIGKDEFTSLKERGIIG